MKDSQLPLQPKHMCSNSIGDICFVSPNIQHLLVPCVLKFYGSFRYISRKATHAHTYMCVCVCIYIYMYIYIYMTGIFGLKVLCPLHTGGFVLSGLLGCDAVVGPTHIQD
jgi:hypothetical protein